ELDHRGLARSGGADERDRLARWDAQRNVLKREHGVVGVLAGRVAAVLARPVRACVRASAGAICARARAVGAGAVRAAGRDWLRRAGGPLGARGAPAGVGEGDVLEGELALDAGQLDRVRAVLEVRAHVE